MKHGKPLWKPHNKPQLRSRSRSKYRSPLLLEPLETRNLPATYSYLWTDIDDNHQWTDGNNWVASSGAPNPYPNSSSAVVVDTSSDPLTLSTSLTVGSLVISNNFAGTSSPSLELSPGVTLTVNGISGITNSIGPNSTVQIDNNAGGTNPATLDLEGLSTMNPSAIVVPETGDPAGNMTVGGTFTPKVGDIFLGANVQDNGSIVFNAERGTNVNLGTGSLTIGTNSYLNALAPATISEAMGNNNDVTNDGTIQVGPNRLFTTTLQINTALENAGSSTLIINQDDTLKTSAATGQLISSTYDFESQSNVYMYSGSTLNCSTSGHFSTGTLYVDGAVCTLSGASFLLDGNLKFDYVVPPGNTDRAAILILNTPGFEISDTADVYMRVMGNTSDQIVLGGGATGPLQVDASATLLVNTINPATPGNSFNLIAKNVGGGSITYQSGNNFGTTAGNWSNTTDLTSQYTISGTSIAYTITVPNPAAPGGGGMVFNPTDPGNNWSDPNNWQQGGVAADTVPTATSTVDIPTGTTCNVDSTTTVGQISLDPGATLNIPSGVTLTVDGGDSSFASALAGTLTVNGTLVIDDGTLDVSTTGTATGSGTVSFTNASALNVADGANTSFSPTVSSDTSSTGQTSDDTVAFGSVQWGGTFSSVGNDSYSSAGSLSVGNLTVTDGTSNFSNGVTVSGSTYLSGELDGDFTANGAATFAGATLSGNDVLNGATTLQGNLTVNGGSLTINGTLYGSTDSQVQGNSSPSLTWGAGSDLELTAPTPLPGTFTLFSGFGSMSGTPGSSNLNGSSLSGQYAATWSGGSWTFTYIQDTVTSISFTLWLVPGDSLSSIQWAFLDADGNTIASANTSSFTATDLGPDYYGLVEAWQITIPVDVSLSAGLYSLQLSEATTTEGYNVFWAESGNGGAIQNETGGSPTPIPGEAFQLNNAAGTLYNNGAEDEVNAWSIYGTIYSPLYSVDNYFILTS